MARRGQKLKKLRRRGTLKKSVFDFPKAVNVVSKTGDVLIGTKSVVKHLATDSLKLVVLANNAPMKTTTQLELYNSASEENLPIYVCDMNSWDLGASVGKPFMVACLGVKKEGDSEILAVLNE